jgi:hypothetical protein
VAIDYFFLTESGVQLRSELELTDEAVQEARAKGEIVKCLALRCLKRKVLFAHVVPCKCADENGIVADMVLQDIEWLGHKRLILKADREPAIQALVKAALTMTKVDCSHVEQASAETPPTYDSQANGGIEVGIRILRGTLRTIKMCLEQRIDRYIPVAHPVVEWMLEHACLLVNVLVRGEDGITAWERNRGRPFSQQLIGFGEVVLYRYPTKGPQHDPHGNIGAQGGEGIFLGYNKFSSTFIVGISDESWIETRSVTRKPAAERWNSEKLAAITARPGEKSERARGHASGSKTQPWARGRQSPKPLHIPDASCGSANPTWRRTGTTTNASVPTFSEIRQGEGRPRAHQTMPSSAHKSP